MRVEFHPEAERELIEAAVYYEHQVPGLGERLGAEVRRGIDLLSENPNIGSRLGPELRQWVLNRFPFRLIYSASPDRVQILAVAHEKRRPGYWRSRAAR